MISSIMVFPGSECMLIVKRTLGFGTVFTTSVCGIWACIVVGVITIVGSIGGTLLAHKLYQEVFNAAIFPSMLIYIKRVIALLTGILVICWRYWWIGSVCW